MYLDLILGIFSYKMVPLPINPPLQHPRTLKPNNSPLIQHQILPSLGIPPPPFPFLFHTEFPKPTDQDILAIGQGTFDDL